MKKIVLTILVSVLALLMVSNAFALSAQTLKLGSDRQTASNPKARLSTDQNVFISGSVTLTNDGNETLNNLRLSSVTPKLGLSVADLSVNATFTVTTLAPNATTTVTVNVRVPEKLDAVDSNFREKSFAVADLSFAGTGASSGSTQIGVGSLELQRRNFLEIKDINICVNDRCKSLSDRGNVDNIRPGDTIDLRVNIKNRYSTVEREDLDIRDTNLEYEINDREFSENDNVDINDISSDEEQEESFSFNVDDDVRDGTFKLEIKTFGRDENGALMGEFNTVDLRVQRKSHDLTLRRVAVSPTVLDCSSSRTVRVTTTVSNVGKRDENKAAIELVSDELKLKDKITGLRLTQDDSRSDTFNEKVADGVKPGTYKINVRTFFDDTAQSDEGSVEVTVPDCNAQTTTSTEPTNNDAASADAAKQAELESRIAELQAQIAAAQQQPIVPKIRTTQPALSGFASSNAYVAVLGLVVLVVVVLIITLIVKFSKPRTE